MFPLVVDRSKPNQSASTSADYLLTQTMSSDNNNHNKEDEEEAISTNAATSTNSSGQQLQYSYPPPNTTTTSPPVQYQQQYSSFPTHNHHNHFYPPPHHQAALSSGPVHQQQHGLYHHNRASSSSFSHYNRSPAEEDGGDSLPSLRNADSNATSRFSSPSGNTNNHINTLGLYTTSTAIRHYYERNSELYNQEILPAANTLANCTRKSPYFSPPPPLPPVAAARDPSPAATTLTVSPNDRRESSSTTIYQQSPYLSEAPALGVGSGSSESSTASTTTTSTSVTTTNNTRPVPARSAFMCFSQAKGEAIKARKGKGSKGGFVEAVASEWRSISKQEKAYWERIAKNEKTRFAKEKDALCRAHNGPVPRKLRAKKNPLVRHYCTCLRCMLFECLPSLLTTHSFASMCTGT